MDLAGAVDLLRARVPGLVLVVLYGSQARGDARADSDVDLALLAEAPIDRWEMLELQAAVAPRVNADVDLVDLMTADDVLRVQVVAHGRTLFERSAAERAGFEMHALSRYAHLNEERRGILEDVVRRASLALRRSVQG
jgi:uncharacterized protein